MLQSSSETPAEEEETIEAFRLVLEAVRAGEGTALATVIRARGSTPRGPGARMAVAAGGKRAGTVGGGAGEFEVVRAALAGIEDGRTRIVHLEMWGDGSPGGGMVCGGWMDVLVEPLNGARDAPWIEGAAGALAAGERSLLLRRLVEGERPSSEPILLVGEREETIWAAPGSPRPHSIPESRGEAIRITPGEGAASLLLEEIRPADRLVIVGGGHIGSALSTIASFLRFSVTIIDERSEYASAARFPHADRVLAGDPARLLREIDRRAESWFVLVTHGHRHDADALRVLLEGDARYIGMIGSRRKVAVVKKMLAAEGHGRGMLDRVFAPVGLSIGAQSPEEIAVSIAAELIAVRSGIADPPGSLSR